jgi:hypothetical protein
MVLARIILWLALVVFGAVTVDYVRRRESAALAAVPVVDVIKKKIVEAGHFSPGEIEVYEIPREGIAPPLKFNYFPDSGRPKLQQMYEVDERGEKFFPDLDGLGTAPVLVYRFRVSRDNRIVSDETFEQKIGDPMPHFPNDARVEIWVSARGYDGKAFQVFQFRRHWGLFSGY